MRTNIRHSIEMVLAIAKNALTWLVQFDRVRCAQKFVLFERFTQLLYERLKCRD